MKICNLFYNYWYFSRKNNQFAVLFYLSQDLLRREHILTDSTQKTLTLLNEHRIKIQKNIGNLNILLSSVCEDCKGKCCAGSIEYYFTAIDFWLRKNSNNKIPIDNYGILPARPLYGVQRRLRILYDNFYNRAKSPQIGNGCFYLGNNGCKLEVSERPIKCVVASCYRLRQAMKGDTKIAYSKSVEALFFVSLRTFDVLKKEAGVPLSYGRLSLLLSP